MANQDGKNLLKKRRYYSVQCPVQRSSLHLSRQFPNRFQPSYSVQFPVQVYSSANSSRPLLAQLEYPFSYSSLQLSRQFPTTASPATVSSFQFSAQLTVPNRFQRSYSVQFLVQSSILQLSRQCPTASSLATAVSSFQFPVQSTVQRPCRAQFSSFQF